MSASYRQGQRAARAGSRTGLIAAAGLLVASGLFVLVAGTPDRAWAQDAAPPAQNGQPLGAAPAPFKPSADQGSPDVWIFSGELNDSHETYSGTLVANKGEAQFELKLGDGATCDGDDLSGEVGLVRLAEITCSDKRTMRALFVPQNGRDLKVFGHVGDERFRADAHLLGTEPPPEAKQTAEPTVPALQGRPAGRTRVLPNVVPPQPGPGGSGPSPR